MLKSRLAHKNRKSYLDHILSDVCLPDLPDLDPRTQSKC